MNEADSLEARLRAWTELETAHGQVGQTLYDTCAGDLFPCDLLAMAVLDRSLNLLSGVRLLLRNEGYICAAALLRLQLDNVLRFHGVVAATGDPHGVAQRIFAGEELGKIKAFDGERMHDTKLRGLLGAKLPGIDSVYKATSGYIHLSTEHIRHFVARSGKICGEFRLLNIATSDEHLSLEHKLGLVHDFQVLTKGVLGFVRSWTEVRGKFGDPNTLKARFHESI
jgi:hypothetical protein